MSGLKIFVVALAVVGIIGGFAAGREIYVAPDGSPDGDGSQANPLDIATAMGAGSPARPGDTILFKGGTYEGPMDGIRRIPFTFSVSGTEDAPIVATPAPGESVHLNGTVTFNSNYLRLIGVEIGDLKWDRFQAEHRNDTALNVLQGGRGSKVINCNIFGGAMGSGVWRPAVDFEMYGCIIHDFGTTTPGGFRGHGHAVYTQNEEGTKLFENNIFYRGCGFNFSAYTQEGFVRGFDVIDNISFAASWYHPGQVGFSFGLSGFQRAERIRFIGNVAYQPRYEQEWRGNFRLLAMHDPAVIHRDAEVCDNYIMGANRGLNFGRWEKAVVTGNTIWAHWLLAEIATAPGGSGFNDPDAPKPDLANYEWDNNTYYDNGMRAPFRYGGGVERNMMAEITTFEQWQALGLDENSRMLPGRDGKPTGAKVFVFPNKYEKGRAHVGVFNWDGLDLVEVDLSDALEVGQAYRVYNTLDIWQTIELAEPVLEAEFDGEKVSLPMKGDEASPDFDAFLVLPVR